MTPTALILTAVAVIFVIGLVAVIVERTEQRDEAYDLVAKAHKTATDAVAQAETFADECKATQAANEILCAELACSDQIIHRLQNDALAAQMAASDADVIPLPVREASPYDWPQNADDAAWQALYDQNGDPR